MWKRIKIKQFETLNTLIPLLGQPANPAWPANTHDPLGLRSPDDPRDLAWPLLPARAPDRGGPCDSERGNRGGRAMARARRRWWLRWGRGHQRVRLGCVHLGEQLIGVIAVAREGGDGNGGPRPRACRLRRANGGLALVAYPTSISNPRRT
jgi:hypothetical protein